MAAHITSGRPRRGKKVRWHVRLIDRLASATITVGGIGTIMSVSLVLVLLLWVVWPLLLPGKLETATRHKTSLFAGGNHGGQPLAIVPDEYRLLAWTLNRQGRLQIVQLDHAQILAEQPLAEVDSITAAQVLEPDGEVALLQADGTLRLGQVKFVTRFLDEAKVPATLTALPRGAVAPYEDGIVERTVEGQLRQHQVTTELRPPARLPIKQARLVAQVPRKNGPLLAVCGEDGLVQFGTLKTSGKSPVAKLKSVPLPEGSGAPWQLLLTERGDNLFVVWRNGRLARFDTSVPTDVKLAETIELLDAGATEITAVGFAPGRETLLVGDNRGRLRAWFRVRNAAAKTSDGAWLLPIRELPSHNSAVASLGASSRGRMVVVGYADGKIQICDTTTGKLLAAQRAFSDEPAAWVALTPKSPPSVKRGDQARAEKQDVAGGVLALSDQAIWQAEFNPGFPEATFQTLFRPVWWESYEKPDHVWQTSSIAATAEPKFGLWPLIFGTIKATTYAMLFGAPLALLAAVYTSEFLTRKVRLRLKSLVEMMAGLPSVVLGFIAAIVIAPVAEKCVPAILASLATIPLALLAGSYLWQQLPHSTALRHVRLRLPLTAAMLLVGVLGAWLLGPLLERWLFAGNVMLWLDGQQGSGTGGWVIILLPFCGLAAALGVVRWANRWLIGFCGRWGRSQFAALNLLKFLVAAAVTLLLAEGLGAVLTLLGFDPRGGVLDTYSQRNALIVGFVMGFAVIPIIYTIAEDALSSVPNHLRSASLGCGATTWQTAVRIVVPTATSGLFSAVMVGLGRAVGETMIVLMAAGNVPLRSFNIFSGFQTLSAAIAAELSEAAQGSPHYRILFLAALCLFTLTFLVNTAAEMVRLRFRRRAVQL